MSSIVENWAIVMGVILGISTPEGHSEFRDVVIKINQAAQFEDYPMLIQQKKGDELTVRFRAENFSDMSLVVDEPVAIRVRQTRDPNLVFAHPDWQHGPDTAHQSRPD